MYADLTKAARAALGHIDVAPTSETMTEKTWVGYVYLDLTDDPTPALSVAKLFGAIAMGTVTHAVVVAPKTGDQWQRLLRAACTDAVVVADGRLAVYFGTRIWNFRCAFDPKAAR